MSLRFSSARRARRALLSAALAVLAVAAVAIAAPDRSVTLSASNPETAWDGPAATGNMDPIEGYQGPSTCSKDAASYCDQTLLKIDSGGPVTLHVAIGEYSDPTSDYDLYVYPSDSSGKIADDAEEIHPSFTDGGDSGWPNGFAESATVEGVAPGYYNVVVVYYHSDNSSYKGEASVEGATPTSGGGGGDPQPTPDPGGGNPQPTPTATPPSGGGPMVTSLPFKASSTLGSAKKAKKKKSLSFKATAGENISNLQLSLLKGKKVLGTAKIASFPKGTRKVKLKVSKKIKKGSYILGARGTVNGQDAQSSQKVKVKK